MLYTYTEDELLGLFRGRRASNIVHETSLPIAVMTDTTSGLEKERNNNTCMHSGPPNSVFLTSIHPSAVLLFLIYAILASYAFQNKLYIPDTRDSMRPILDLSMRNQA